MDDHALLRQFAEAGSQTAFRELVGRYANLVYASALTRVRDAHAAHDVSQAVILTLAIKAKDLRGHFIAGPVVHGDPISTAVAIATELAEANSPAVTATNGLSLILAWRIAPFAGAVCPSDHMPSPFHPRKLPCTE